MKKKKNYTIEIQATIVASMEIKATSKDEAVIKAKEEILADGYEITDFHFWVSKIP